MPLNPTTQPQSLPPKTQQPPAGLVHSSEGLGGRGRPDDPRLAQVGAGAHSRGPSLGRSPDCGHGANVLLTGLAPPALASPPLAPADLEMEPVAAGLFQTAIPLEGR